MGQPRFKERRITERRRLTGLLPGRLVIEELGADLVCKPVDVSAHGLGIVMSHEIPPGTGVNLVMKDQTIAMRIAWGQPDFGKRDMFRYGLVTLDPSVDLEALFVKAGCLR